jgi:hypothetical protein
LFFGGVVSVDHRAGTVSVGGDWIKLKSAPRIGVLVNQMRWAPALDLLKLLTPKICLRRILDGQMQKSIDSADLGAVSNHNPIIEAMLAVLERDGLDPDSL